MPVDGDWTPAHYALLLRIQKENRCEDVICRDPSSGHCYCRHLMALELKEINDG